MRSGELATLLLVAVLPLSVLVVLELDCVRSRSRRGGGSWKPVVTKDGLFVSFAIFVVKVDDCIAKAGREKCSVPVNVERRSDVESAAGCRRSTL